MPRWPRRASPLSSGSQRYLPRRRAASIRRPVSASGEAGRPAQVAAHRSWVQDVDAGDGGAEDVALEAGPHDLDLGQLRHRCRPGVSRGPRRRGRRSRPGRRPRGRWRSRRRPSRRRPARPPSSSGPRRCRRAPSPTRTWAVKVFMWSGPSSSMTYSGTPRPCSADSSCSEVFQSRPAPRAEAASMSGSNNRCTTSAETAKPPLRCTAPRTASTVSERIEALFRPPVDSSPRPSLTCSPRPMPRPTSASARALTTAARSLASRPSERSGCVRYERLGHDDAEHRVAQELQALVGRQAAVLVGVGPVGEGALEQLGIQLRVPERRSQLAVVGQRTGS